MRQKKKKNNARISKCCPENIISVVKCVKWHFPKVLRKLFFLQKGEVAWFISLLSQLYFFTFSVLLERAIWQPMWCSQGSVLQLLRFYSLTHSFTQVARFIFSGGCMIFFVGEAAWFLGRGCKIFWERACMIFLVERLPVFFGGHIYIYLIQNCMDTAEHPYRVHMGQKAKLVCYLIGIKFVRLMNS